MRDRVDALSDLQSRLRQFNPLVPVRVVTVVPGVEYYGKVMSVGSDNVVLETDFHVVTVALSHIVSAYRDPTRGLLPATQPLDRQVGRDHATERTSKTPRTRKPGRSRRAKEHSTSRLLGSRLFGFATRR